MAKKNNIRSIRFSDEIIEMIESQAGETFTAKFEALVTKCMWELPAKEKELAAIQARINEERENFRFVQREVGKLRNTVRGLNYTLESMTRQINQAIDQAQSNLGIE